MKKQLRFIFAPILDLFESGDGSYAYKSSHRTILIFIGCLFGSLAALVFSFSMGKDPGYLFPVLIFGGAGFLALLIGLIGNDRAVAKIWGFGKE